MNRIAATLLSEKWLIHQPFANTHIPILVNAINGNVRIDASGVSKIEKEEGEKILASIIPTAGVDGGVKIKRISDLNSAPDGSIAVVKIHGAMIADDMTDDNCEFIMGTRTIAQIIAAINNAPNIDGLIIDFDTPGGTVRGTEELASVIKNFSKPKVGFVRGMAASAGMWCAVHCDSIIMGGETAEVGSIGVMMQWLDTDGYLEAMGIKINTVRASQSPDKNAPFYMDLTEEEMAAQLQINGLDPICDIFIKNVKSGRSNADRPLTKDAPVFTGKMFFSKDAIKYGLADSIGTFDDAIASVRKKSKKNKNKGMNAENETINYQAAFKELVVAETTNALNVKHGAEIAVFEAKLADAQNQFQDSEANLSAEKGKVADLTAKLSKMEGEKASLSTSLAEANDKISQLQTEISVLKEANERLASATNEKPIEVAPAATVVKERKTFQTKEEVQAAAYEKIAAYKAAKNQ